MKIVYSWLREFLPEAPDPHTLEGLLAGLGIETESITTLPQPHAKVVFARVLTAEAIPGADVKRLTLDIGHEVTVVSGAPNAKAGMGIALAMPGAALPGGLELGVRKIQGIESFGMGLSPKELGIGDYAGGLMEFAPQALPPGTPLAEVWPAEQVIEIEITPNRPDWLSVWGVARDLSALGYTLLNPNPQPHTTPLDLPFKVWLQDPEGCDRFTLSYVRGVRVEPSPLLVQRRLYAAGMRPISNVVDATNYAMLELGNPMHAFDVRDIGQGLVVRRAQEGEKLTTLDGVERTLDPRDLLITAQLDHRTVPEGLAGVMGGANSEVRPSTTEIALEVAHFDPVTIRRTAKRHGLRSEASYRFERGVDPDGQVRAALRFTELLQQWGQPVQVAQERIDINYVAPRSAISFKPSYTNRLVGGEWPVHQQLQALVRLGCNVQGQAEPYLVTPPSFRADLTIPEDLVEEVVRVIGYEHIPLHLPSFFPAPDNLEVEAPYQQTERLKQALAGLGFQEVINYSWSSAEECQAYRAPAPTVFMLNPQSSDRTALRTVLYPGLIHNLQTSLAQGEAGPFLLFEVGTVFQAAESTKLAALLSGDWVRGGWQPGLAGGFYALKGLLQALAQQQGAALEVLPEPVPHLHPGISGAVYWNSQKVGHIGVLHPSIAAAQELPAVVLFELDLPLPKAKPSFSDIAKFPASLRDLAVLLPESVPYVQVRSLIESAAGPLLKQLEVFDLYRGKPLQDGQKSLAFHLVFRHPERTLNDVETDGFMSSVIAAVEQQGWAIRK